MYIVHDLNNLDAYTLCPVHEQDSVLARHERVNYTHAIACVIYTAHSVIHASMCVYCSCAICKYTCANVKFKIELYCT